MKTTIIRYKLHDLDEIVNFLVKVFVRHPIVLLRGDIGVGKTTLVRAILQKVGIVDAITSPTFNYVNHYVNSSGEAFYHFDLYRIAEVEQLIMLGLIDFFHLSYGCLFIEWPDIAVSFLPKDKICNVTIRYTDIATERFVEVSVCDSNG